jgi:hypothetical protein
MGPKFPGGKRDVQTPYSHRKIAAYLMLLSGITHPAQMLASPSRA